MNCSHCGSPSSQGEECSLVIAVVEDAGDETYETPIEVIRFQHARWRRLGEERTFVCATCRRQLSHEGWRSLLLGALLLLALPAALAAGGVWYGIAHDSWLLIPGIVLCCITIGFAWAMWQWRSEWTGLLTREGRAVASLNLHKERRTLRTGDSVYLRFTLLTPASKGKLAVFPPERWAELRADAHP